MWLISVALDRACAEPYGLFEMPPGPYEPAHDPATDSVSSIPNLIWRLNPDEAVVIFQCTPPQSRYFGLTGYVVGTFAVHKNDRIRP